MPTGIYPRKPPIEKAREKIKIQTNGCLFWMGAKNTRGYGVLRLNGKTVSAHRFFYNFKNPEFPISYDGTIQLDHLCENKICCNPEHLEPVTNRENVSRGFKTKNTSSKHTGVYWNKPARKWLAHIQINGKVKHLGCFDDEIDASNAYENKIREIEQREGL